MPHLSAGPFLRPSIPRDPASVAVSIRRPVVLSTLPAAIIAAAAFPALAQTEKRETEATKPAERRFEIDPTTVEAPVEIPFRAESASASKSSLTLRETPQSVSVITRDSLDARQVTDLGQAIETAAGVTLYSGNGPFSGRGSFGLGAVQIRGIDTDFLTDLREDGFASPLFGAQPDVAPFEQVEVVKGPSALFGRGSAGGFLNRVRKRPLDELQSELVGSFGSFDYYRVDGDLTGPMNPSKSVRGRVVLAYENAGAFVDEVESERVVVSPSFDADLGEHTRLRFNGTYQYDGFLPNNGFPLLEENGRYRAPRIRRSLFVGVPNRQDSRGEILSGSLVLEQDLTDGWLATLRFAKTNTSELSGGDSYAYGVVPGGDVNLYASDFRIENDVWAGELRIEGEFDALGRTVDVAFGVEHTDVRNVNDQKFGVLGTANLYEENFDEVPIVPPEPAYNGLFEQPSTGGYLNLRLRPIERVSLLLGTRYDSTESSAKNRFGGTEDETDDSALTGRMGLVWDPWEPVSLYVLYARSFRPILFDVGRDGKLLDPETGEIYEVGAKTEWLDERLGVTAAIFRIDRDDVPISDPDNQGGEFFSVMGGKQQSDGIELEVNGEPLPGWTISFAGTLLDTEFTERDDPGFGSIPSGAADWQVGLFTSYELQETAFRGLGAGVGLFAIDERGLGGEIPLDGYERLDLNAFYKGLEPFEIALQVRNVLDERYVEGADRPAFAQFGSPTAVLLQVSVRPGADVIERLTGWARSS